MTHEFNMESEDAYEVANPATIDLVNNLIISFLNLDTDHRSLFLKLLIIKLEDVEVDLVLQMGNLRGDKDIQDDIFLETELEPSVKDEPNELDLKTELEDEQLGELEQFNKISELEEEQFNQISEIEEDQLNKLEEDSLEFYENEFDVDINQKPLGDQELVDNNTKRFEKKTRKCTLCDYKCNKESMLFRHVKHKHREKKPKTKFRKVPMENKSKSLKCIFCKNTFASELTLIRHLRRSHAGEECKRYVEKLRTKKCDLCDKIFVCKSKLIRHMKTIHAEKKPKGGIVIKKFICSICLKSFSSKERVVFHIKQHSVDHSQKSDEELLSNYTLDMPDKFSREGDDSKVEDDKNIPVSKTCPFCKEVFEDVRNNPGRHQYSSHVLSHKYENFTCDCNIVFKTKRQKSEHVKIVHMGYSKCDVCYVSVRNKEALERHMETHDDPTENEILCDLCGEASPSKTLLTNHMKKVHGKGLYTCKICGKQLVSKSGLSTHKKTHLGPEQCPICGDFFKQLKVHMNQKHQDDSDKNHQCDVCKKGFLTMYEVNKHKMSAHIKARPYNCRYGCTFAYNDKSNRNAHERKKHGAVFTNGAAADNNIGIGDAFNYKKI